jgi:outer membrane protein assembly factor BamB
MKAKRIFGDRAMRALLKDYERPKADRARFEEMLDKAMEGPKIVAMPRRPASSAFAWAAAAAAAVLLVGGGILMRSALFLDAPLAVYRVDASPAQAPFSVNRQGRFPASPDAELRFRAKGETVAAAAGTTFSINQDPWRILNGRKIDEYRIDSGALAIVHDDPARPFILRTPLGEVRPLGTALSLKLERDSLELACTEGRIAFRPSSSRSEIIVEAGYVLRYAKGESLPAAVRLREGEPLPFAPEYPEIKEVPVGIKREWSSPLQGSHETERLKTESGKTEKDRGSRGRDADSSRDGSELRKSWSVDSELSGAERMESAGGGIAVLKGAKLAAWDAVSGKRRFSLSLESKPDGFAAGPDLYFLFGGQLACLDSATGKEKWRVKTGPISFSDIGAARGMVAVASADGYLYVVDAASGALLRRQAAGIGMYGSPLIMKDLIAVSALDGRILGFAPAGKGPAWSYQAFERLTGDRPAALAGSTILDADSKGGLVALDSGGALSWKGGYAAPLKRGPIALGDFAAFEDASGLKLIKKDGSVSDPGFPASDALVAAAPSRRGALLITTDCVWLLDGQGRKSARLLKADIARAAVDGDRVLILEDSGELSSWNLADE